jgi:hypothetical protein
LYFLSTFKVNVVYYFEGFMTRKGPIKDCVVALRCDQATKESLENMADARNTTVSRLVFGLIRDGAKLERERTERLRQLRIRRNAVIT